ncbi:hypothetical protein JCM13991_21930 [Thermodesulfovibrio hydrogeniphilus]
MKMAKKILYILLVLTCLIVFSGISFAEAKKQVTLYLFWREGCPYCEKEKLFLSQIKKKYPTLEIKDYDVISNIASRELLMTMSRAYGINPSGVPVTFIGNQGFVGFNEEIASQIEKNIKYCLKNICQDPLFYKSH